MRAALSERNEVVDSGRIRLPQAHKFTRARALAILALPAVPLKQHNRVNLFVLTPKLFGATLVRVAAGQPIAFLDATFGTAKPGWLAASAAIHSEKSDAFCVTAFFLGAVNVRGDPAPALGHLNRCNQPAANFRAILAHVVGCRKRLAAVRANFEAERPLLTLLGSGWRANQAPFAMRPASRIGRQL